MKNREQEEAHIILELLKEIREDHKELSRVSSSHREETLQWQAETSNRLEHIEIDLREHKEGVINNRKLLADSSKRLEILERPRLIFGTIKEAIIAGGKVLTALGVIGGALAWLSSVV